MSYYPPSQSHPMRQAYYPTHEAYPTHRGYAPQQAGNGARNRVVLIAVGIVFAFLVLGALLAGGDSSGYSDSGYSDSGYSADGSGGSSQIYGDSGSITTTDDGTLIYSDSNGNSLSTGG